MADALNRTKYATKSRLNYVRRGRNKPGATPVRRLVAWTEEDEDTLVELKTKGLSWSTIRQNLPNRTLSALGNRWRTLSLRRRVRDAGDTK